ncbi:MAG TPA: DUF92 domain-containing protein [Candidatus Acidoferrales bacterium]|nr:DUF92 domain-containing protein [Candidatus Acidoferrales bacterium]
MIGLSRGGLVAAAVVGIATIWAGHWQGALVLFAFFIPSTLLSRVGRERKRTLVDIGKQGARDAMQVLANGGVATAAILLSLRFGAPMLAAFAGAYAAASADTWATEIGTLARGAPRSILTLRPLEPGLSGGVTWQGSAAQIAGAALVAYVAWQLALAPFLAVAIGGVAGSLLDSLLGATLQSLRYCPSCARECETNPHHCGTPTIPRRGAAWLDNDVVNLAATLCGGVVSAALVASGALAS